MQFVQMGEESHRRRWFRMPNTDFEVLLYLPDTSVMVGIQKKYQNDMKALQSHVASHWFLDFKNAETPEGEPIDNTSENRAAMLEALDVWVFVNAKLAAAAEWRTEGNGGSSGG